MQVLKTKTNMSEEMDAAFMRLKFQIFRHGPVPFKLRRAQRTNSNGLEWVHSSEAANLPPFKRPGEDTFGGNEWTRAGHVLQHDVALWCLFKLVGDLGCRSDIRCEPEVNFTAILTGATLNNSNCIHLSTTLDLLVTSTVSNTYAVSIEVKTKPSLANPQFKGLEDKHIKNKSHLIQLAFQHCLSQAESSYIVYFVPLHGVKEAHTLGEMQDIYERGGMVLILCKMTIKEKYLCLADYSSIIRICAKYSDRFFTDAYKKMLVNWYKERVLPYCKRTNFLY